MHKFLLAGSAGGLFMLSDCAGTTSATAITDAQSALVDGQAIVAALEADGRLTGTNAATATEALEGLSALLAADTATAGATAEQQAIAMAIAAVQQVKADLPDNGTVQAASSLASTALSALSATSTDTAKVQAEAAVAAVLLDYLAAQGGTQATAARVGHT